MNDDYRSEESPNSAARVTNGIGEVTHKLTPHTRTSMTLIDRQSRNCIRCTTHEHSATPYSSTYGTCAHP